MNSIVLKLKALITGGKVASKGPLENVYTQTYSTASKNHPAMTSADMPAGGAGAAAGAWDTAINRDAAIAEFAALRADVLALKQLVNAMIDDNKAIGLAD